MWNRVSRRHVGERISAADGVSRAPFCGRYVVPTQIADLAARTVTLLNFSGKGTDYHAVPFSRRCWRRGDSMQGHVNCARDRGELAVRPVRQRTGGRLR